MFLCNAQEKLREVLNHTLDQIENHYLNIVMIPHCNFSDQNDNGQ